MVACAMPCPILLTYGMALCHVRTLASGRISPYAYAGSSPRVWCCAYAGADLAYGATRMLILPWVGCYAYADLWAQSLGDHKGNEFTILLRHLNGSTVERMLLCHGIAYAAMPWHSICCYAMSGTDIAYAAMLRIHYPPTPSQRIDS
eukprot:841794-Rhodomonas_salina.2